VSTSKQYFEALIAGERGMDWGAAVRVVGELFGKQANARLAGVTGKTHKSAERWTAKATDKINPKTGLPSQSATPDAPTQVKIVEYVQRLLAAQKVRDSPTAHCGKVTVRYPDTGADEGTRDIGDVNLDQEDLDAIADEIENGDLDAAAELLDQAVLDDYGVPEGVLEIEDYENGFWMD
jgi:hypothetical protein